LARPWQLLAATAGGAAKQSPDGWRVGFQAPAALILDRHTVSDCLRGAAQVAARLQALRPADIGMTASVEYELRYGLRRLPQQAATPRVQALTRHRGILITRNLREFAHVSGLQWLNLQWLNWHAA
jgi:hypothetical protein